MGSIKSRVLKLVLSLTKAREIFSQYDYDFNIIVSKIFI